MVMLCAMSSVRSSILTRSPCATSIRAGSNAYRLAARETRLVEGSCSWPAARPAASARAAARKLRRVYIRRFPRLYDGPAGLVVCLRRRWCDALFLQQRFTAESNLARRIDIDHFDEHLLALFEFVAHVFHAVIGDLRHVEQAVGARHDLDEGAEVGDALNFAQVGFVQLR